MRKVTIMSRLGRMTRGAGLVEYGMLAGLVAAVAIGSVAATGDRVESVFCSASDAMRAAVGGEVSGDCTILATGPSGPGGVGGKSGGESGGPGSPDPESAPSQPTGPVISETYEPTSDDLVLIYEGASAMLQLSNASGTIYWPDGTTSAVSIGTSTYNKTFADAGPHTVTFVGTAQGFTGAEPNLVEVVSFGNVGITSLWSAFSGSHGLRAVADLPPTVTSLQAAFQDSTANPTGVETWNTQNVTNFSDLFYNATAFNRDLSNWRTGSGTNFFGMFRNATLFDQDISGWDVSAGTTFAYMFQNADAFNAPIGGWDTGSATVVTGMFTGADVFSADLPNWDLSSVTNATNAGNMFYLAGAFDGDLSGWCVPNIMTRPTYFTDGTGVTRQPAWGYCGLPEPGEGDFTAIYENVTTAPTVTMTANVSGPGMVFWGDGSYGPLSSTLTHTYAAPGTYTVSIKGNLTAWKNGMSSPDLVAVTSFGSTTLLSDLSLAFYNADKLTSVPAVLPPTVVNLHAAFQNMGNNPVGMETWDTGNVRRMSAMFKDATLFNRDISGWNTSSVASVSPSTQNMDEMFRGATSFAQNLSGWCVQNLTSGSYYDNFATGSQITALPNWGAACN